MELVCSEAELACSDGEEPNSCSGQAFRKVDRTSSDPKQVPSGAEKARPRPGEVFPATEQVHSATELANSET